MRKLREIDSDMMNRWNDVEESYNEDFHHRLRSEGESRLKFKVSARFQQMAVKDSCASR